MLLLVITARRFHHARCIYNHNPIAFRSDIKLLRCRAVSASLYPFPATFVQARGQIADAMHAPQELHSSVWWYVHRTPTRVRKPPSARVGWQQAVPPQSEAVALATPMCSSCLLAYTFSSIVSRRRTGTRPLQTFQLMQHAHVAGLQRRCEGRVCQREGSQGVDCNVARQAAAFQGRGGAWCSFCHQGMATGCCVSPPSRTTVHSTPLQLHMPHQASQCRKFHCHCAHQPDTCGHNLAPPSHTAAQWVASTQQAQQHQCMQPQHNSPCTTHTLNLSPHTPTPLHPLSGHPSACCHLHHPALQHHPHSSVLGQLW
jgi:hypothetical protein